MSAYTGDTNGTGSILINNKDSNATPVVTVDELDIINAEPEQFLKLKSNLSSNPMILKAGIDGFLDTFDEFYVGKRFYIRSGQVSEKFKFKTLKIHRNDEGHVSNIMAVLI